MTELLTLTEVKQHLRVVDNTDDALIQRYMASAVEQCEAYLNRKIVADHYEADEIKAAYPAFDADTDDEITYAEAYPEPIVINNSIVCACLLMVGHLFENRQAVLVGATPATLPMGFESILAPYRVNMGI